LVVYLLDGAKGVVVARGYEVGSEGWVVISSCITTPNSN